MNKLDKLRKLLSPPPAIYDGGPPLTTLRPRIMKTRTNHGAVVDLETHDLRPKPCKKYLLYAPTLPEAERYARAKGWGMRDWIWFGPHGHRGLRGIRNPHLRVIPGARPPEAYFDLIENAPGSMTFLQA